MERKIQQIECLLDVCSLTEEQCREKLFSVKWGEKACCPKCGNTDRISYLKTRNVYKCLECSKQFSLVKGTLFENSNMPLKKWFAAIYLMSTEVTGISSVQMAKHLKIEQNTAWYIMQKLRFAMSGCDSIGLLGGIVEIDETFLGAVKTKDKRLAFKVYLKRKKRIQMEAEGLTERDNRLKRLEMKTVRKGNKKKARPTLKAIFNDLPYISRELLRDWEVRNIMYQPLHYKKNVVGIVERNIFDSNGKLLKLGRLRLTKMGRHKGDLTRVNVQPFIEENVSRSSHIMTDDNRIYRKLPEIFQQHSVIKHSQSGVNQQFAKHADGEVTTNYIENVWKHLKKVENGTYIHYSWKYTQCYLDEFTFRFNRRESKPLVLFQDLFSLTIGKTISRKEMVGIQGKYYYYPKGAEEMNY
ncbi:MAG: hypothetical protein RLZ33_711 [Bacteroidota bacterium]|jgi:transposase-like protein